MLSGATGSAAAIVGTPVFRIVVSSDSMKNATAISHGRRRLLESASEVGFGGLGVNLRVGDYRRFCGIRRTAKCGSHGRIGMRLLLLLICPKDPLGNTSGLQDSDCGRFLFGCAKFDGTRFGRTRLNRIRFG